MENKELNEIFKNNVPKLYSFVRKCIGNKDDAEDIVQDVFYQFLRTISVLDNPISHVSSWLYTVAHNLIINHSKKHREDYLKDIPLEDDDSFITNLSWIMMADDNESPEIKMLRSMIWKEWESALNQLPKEQRDALIMTEINDLSVKEAASQMGVSVNTFLSRKHYAIKYIRKRLYNLYTELIQG